MRIESIEVRTLDGLNGPLTAERFGPGVNVVLGPNASGKSSLVRALRAVLYPEAVPGLVDVRLTLVAPGGARFLAHRLGGSVTWRSEGRETGPPRLPPLDVVGAYLLDLEHLVAPGDPGGGPSAVDGHIARRLELELTGGVDLEGLRSQVPGPGSAGRNEAGALRRAEQELEKVRRDRLRLHERELRLGADEAELKELRRVAGRGALVGPARELADALDAEAAAEGSLRALPRELEGYQPTYVATLQDLRSDLEDALDGAGTARGQLEEARKVASEGRLPPELTREVAREHLGLAEDLCRLEDEARTVAADVAAAEASAAESWRLMGGAPGHAGAQGADRAVIDEAAQAAFRLHEAELNRASLSRRLGELGVSRAAAGEAASGEERAAALRRAADELTRCLELPAPTPRLPRWAWAIALLVAALAAAAAPLSPPPWPFALAAASFAWLLAAYAFMRRDLVRERATVQGSLLRALERAGVEAPSDMSSAPVAACLAEVVELLSAEARRREEREEQDRLAAQIGAALAEAEAKRVAAADHLAELRSRHGFVAPGDAGFVQWLALAREHALARVRLRELAARKEELLRESRELRARLHRFLVEVGDRHADGEPATVLRERCRRLVDSVAERDDAVERAAVLERQVDKAVRAAATAAGRISSLAARVGRLAALEGPEAASRADDAVERWTPQRLDDLTRHVQGLERLAPSWDEARKQLLAARARIALGRRAVAGDPELATAAEARDRAAIDAVEAAAKRAAEEADERSEVIGALKAELDKAGSERHLERAAAAARRARDALEAHREVKLQQAAALFLLDDVEGEHEAVSKPAALESAREWFARVTHGEFELTFERAEAGGWRFGAVDLRAGEGGRRLALDQLSTGTRAQLLIAARLAFALTLEAAVADEGEELATLPFVLDEALTTSDPERFAQVAGAVLDIVETAGRQFVYLSARPEDAAMWREAAAARPGDPLMVIELGGEPARSAASTAPDRRSLALPGGG